jgi:hypothetical protein
MEVLANSGVGGFIGALQSYLRDTLAVLAAVQDSPGDAAGVLSLQEERLGLAVLESEDLAVATDVDFTLRQSPVSFCNQYTKRFHGALVKRACLSHAGRGFISKGLQVRVEGRSSPDGNDQRLGKSRGSRAYLARVNSDAGE